MSRLPVDAHDTERVVVITGMSGAGKTAALKAFEDMGFEAVDNLPLLLLGGLIGAGPLKRPVALGIDVRTRDFDTPRLLATLNALRAERHLRVTLLFLDADDETLSRRYTETRRRHPMAGDLPLADGLAVERSRLRDLREAADLVIDTAWMPPAELKSWLETRFAAGAAPRMNLSVISFGFRNGLPRGADLVFDVRFLRNPHYDPALRPLTGCDAPVGAYIQEDPDFAAFFTNLTTLLAPLLPRYEQEGKSYLTVAIGCTGGRHRSVFTAEHLAAWLRGQGQTVTVRHRDTPEAGKTHEVA